MPPRDRALHGEHQRQHRHAHAHAHQSENRLKHPGGGSRGDGGQSDEGEGDRAQAAEHHRPVADSVHQPPDDDRRHDPAEHQRGQRAARLDRGSAEPLLHQERHVRDGAEHGRADHQSYAGDGRHHPIREQVEGHHRLGRPPLDPHQPPSEPGSGPVGEPRPRPAAGHPGLADGEHQQRDRGHQQNGTGVVDGAPHAGGRVPQGGPHRHRGQDAERDVEIEHPAPGEQRGDVAPRERPRDRGDSPHRAQQPLRAAPLFQRVVVGDDAHSQRHQTAGAEPLQRPEHDELRHGAGRAGEGGAQQKDADAPQIEAPPSVQIGELAPQRNRDRRRQQVGGEHPAVPGEPAELLGDGRHCRRDDGHFDGGEEGAPQHAGRHHHPAGAPDGFLIGHASSIRSGSSW